MYIKTAIGVAILTKFHKDVWHTDTSNFLLHPKAYVSDCLMKEILDKFLLLQSLKVVMEILAPYLHLQNQEHTLWGILKALWVDFNRFAVEKKAETTAKCKATVTAKAVERDTAQVPEIGATLSNDEHTETFVVTGVTEHLGVDTTSNSVGPSRQQAPCIDLCYFIWNISCWQALLPHFSSKSHKRTTAKHAQHAPVLSTKEVFVGYGPTHTNWHWEP